MPEQEIVSREVWLESRAILLAKEKAFTRQRDELSAARREMPWVKVDEPYGFETEAGDKTLAGLFAGRSQLVIYQFMMGPDWKQGCKSCSFWADSFNGIDVHLAQRDVTFIAASRAPLSTILPFKQRMGWSFDWVSSAPSQFNVDFQVSFDQAHFDEGNATYNYKKMNFETDELVGISVFYRNDSDEVFHTYSTYGRGVDLMNTAYNYLDLTPKGRDEDGLENTMAWLRHHDNY